MGESERSRVILGNPTCVQSSDSSGAEEGGSVRSAPVTAHVCSVPPSPALLGSQKKVFPPKGDGCHVLLSPFPVVPSFLSTAHCPPWSSGPCTHHWSKCSCNSVSTEGITFECKLHGRAWQFPRGLPQESGGLTQHLTLMHLFPDLS